jgi:predicted SnoaL-like aldol condensation-catalyzing enzyme
MQMKKIVYAASAIISCFLLSCGGTNSGGMSDKAKKNLDNAQAVAKMFESGDWSKAGDYFAADAVDHAGMRGDVKGLDSIKANFAMMGNMMSNFKNEVVREWADDDYTVQWLKESATMKVDDPMMGMKAGSRNTFNAIEVSKFNNDGKISEHWGFIDWNDMMKMMPQQGPMGNMMDNKKDAEDKMKSK